MSLSSFLPWRRLAWICALVAVLAACGASSNSEPAAPAPPTPTPLIADFRQPTTVIDPEAAREAQAAAQEPTADSAALDTGQRLYANLCAECHGPALEGTDQAGALTALEMTAGELAVFLRTGGGLGNFHLFGTGKVSNPGIESLFTYLESMQSP